MNEIEFERKIDNVLAQADAAGVWVHCGWSMGIPRAKAVEYVEKYNTDPNSGFFEHEGSVILSHSGGKITFSQQEGDAVVALINAAYTLDRVTDPSTPDGSPAPPSTPPITGGWNGGHGQR